MSRATITKVASEAGVSRSTVSNVINNPEIVAAETRQRVQSTMRRMGFQPNHMARGLRTATSKTIACFVLEDADNSSTDSYYALVLLALSSAARAAGYDFMIHVLYGQSEDELLRARALLAQRKVDGAVLIATPLDEATVQALRAWQEPIVLFDRHVPDLSLPFVWADYQDGVVQSVQHLHAQGCQAVGFLAGFPSQLHTGGVARLEGYQRGLTRVGLPLDPRLIYNADWSFGSGRDACDALMNLPAPPDAVIAASDRMALGFLQRAAECGLRVPEDVAVVGFNDMEFTQYVSPPLSTVRLPIVEMARAAVALVLRRIAGESAAEAHGTILPVAFIARRSGGMAELHRSVQRQEGL
ncbi:LacI family DNA-binding transcriptional regulator [Deinococcus sp.]|uniref:LacI family DNA-binding transcriptional regulator n=1 Tax=Deinococcus sp. TaxID=47478 RepID=UPI003CC60DF3